MAPVYVAARLPLSVLFVIVVALSVFTKNVNSLLAYDRQALLDIRSTCGNLTDFPRHRASSLPPLLAGIPRHLYVGPVLPRRRRHRTRSRGRRSGQRVKLKAGVCVPAFTAVEGVQRMLTASRATGEYSFSHPRRSWLVPICTDTLFTGAP